jgi:hypothetical protein
MTIMAKIKESVFLSGLIVFLTIYFFLAFLGITKLVDRRKGVFE